MGPATGFTPCLLAESQPLRRMLAFYGAQELDYFDQVTRYSRRIKDTLRICRNGVI